MVDVTGERALVFELIRRAVEDALGRWNVTGYDSEKDEKAALRWIFSTNTGAQSLSWYCDLIERDPEHVRQFVRQNRKRKEKTSPQGKSTFEVVRFCYDEGHIESYWPVGGVSVSGGSQRVGAY